MAIIRMALYITAVLLGGFCAVFMLLRLWPYDDRDLRLLLMPDDCLGPCFLGIQPGLTKPDEAVRLLRQHDWVAPDSVHRTSGGEVLWAWSGRQPALINSSIQPMLIVWSDNRELQVIDGIQIPLRLPVGQALLALGEPPTLNVGHANSPTDVPVIALYDHYALEVWSHVACPITRRKFLESPLNLYWLSSADTAIPARLATVSQAC
ncbi:MAG: hypothetical protein R3E39_28670 [Anaerolineae bacterium]